MDNDYNVGKYLEGFLISHNSDYVVLVNYEEKNSLVQRYSSSNSVSEMVQYKAPTKELFVIGRQ